MNRPRRPRPLSDEDVTLWHAVAKTVDRRAGSVLPAMPPAVSAPFEPVVPPATATTIPPGALEKAGWRSPPPLADLDRRTRTRIERGRIGIERRVDLHGLTQADAHAVLRRFLFSAYADDVRLVLVVTGKGERARRSDVPFDGPGVLRRMVPHWLRDVDLRALVLGFEAAGVAHGGSGALYIRLRRRRTQI